MTTRLAAVIAVSLALSIAALGCGNDARPKAEPTSRKLVVEIRDGLRASLESPPATLLVLPNGWVKVAAALPQICADLRHDRLDAAWDAYRAAWRSDKVISAASLVIDDQAMLANANGWQPRASHRIEIITEDP